MLKREVREMVKFLIGERKSFKVIFANGQVEVVEYKGYCWVLSGKAYSDEELVEKCVRFQNNEKKFILSFAEVEEEVEEVAVEEVESVNYEESLVEEVENLTDDLFDESDIAYAEEAIKRESATIINTPMTYKEFSKLPIEERKEIVRARIGEQINLDYLDMICKYNYKVMVNDKDIYDCYFTDLGVRIFRYGKHPKQCKIWGELKDTVSKIQVIGTI